MPGILGIVRFNNAPVAREQLAAVAGVPVSRGVHHTSLCEGSTAFLVQNDTESWAAGWQEACLFHDRQSGLIAATDARLDEKVELARSLGIHSARRTSTAELIGRAYQRWGRRCLDRLTGDFAFAIWERKKNSVFCARDPFGVRSLYWGWENDCFYFASEMQQILALRTIDDGIDELAVADILVRRCHQDHERTILRGIQRLPHAHYLVAQSSGQTVSRYWEPTGCDDLVYGREEDYAEHFAEIFSRAIEDRLSEKRDGTGLLMSGGLDSCSVAATARSLLHERGDHLRVRSAVFDECPKSDERRYIAAMEQHCNLEIEYVPGEHFPWFEALPGQTAPLELPVHPWQPYFRHVFSKFHEDGVPVVLTGIGGDTLMTGSRLVYLDDLLSGKLSAFCRLYSSARRRGIPVRRLFYRSIVDPLIPVPFRKMARGLRAARGRHIPSWISPSFAARTNIAARLYPHRVSGGCDSLARRAIRDEIMGPGLEAGLRAIDCYAERQGCVVRHPFLDRRLAEFILAIPPQQLLAGALTKDLLRRAMKDILPTVVADRADKTYLTSFMHFNFKQTLKADILNLLHSSQLHEMDIIDAKALRRTYEAYCQGRIPLDASDLWAVLSLERWCCAYNSAASRRASMNVATMDFPARAHDLDRHKTA